MGGSGGGQGGGSQISAYMNQGVPIQASGFGSGVAAPGGFVGAAPVGIDLYQNMLSQLQHLFGPNTPWNYFGANDPTKQAQQIPPVLHGPPPQLMNKGPITGHNPHPGIRPVA